MITKIKKLFVLISFCVCALVVAGCGDESKVEDYVKEFKLGVTETSESFDIKTTYESAKIAWESSDTEKIIISGSRAIVTPGDVDVDVTLTATFTVGEASKTAEYVVKVLAKPAPEAIEISSLSGFRLVDGVYLIELNTTGQFFALIDEEANQSVTWQASNSRVTVNGEGVVTAATLGTSTIVVSSIADSSVRATASVEVVEDFDAGDVLINAGDYITENLPKYVVGDFTLPDTADHNPAVEVTYISAAGEEIVNNEYIMNYKSDTKEKIEAIVTYKGQEQTFSFMLQVVGDEEINDFAAIEKANELISAELEAYLGDNPEYVAADLALPTFFTAEETLKQVGIVWEIDARMSPVPLTLGAVGEDANQRLATTYTKPNDDASVTLVATIKSGYVEDIATGTGIYENTDSYRYRVTVRGYSKEEIIQYLRDNILPAAEADGSYVINGANTILATADTTNKFRDLTIAWQTSNADVISETGKFVDIFLEAETQVTLTAVIKYAGTFNTATKDFSFEETVEFPFTVKPTENDAQALVLLLANELETEEYDYLKYFPYGLQGRDGGNKMPVPTKVSDITDDASIAEYADTAITWSAREEGLFDAEMNLLKQYLRYHEAVLTYTVTDSEGNSATGEYVSNVGVTKVQDAAYFGGRVYDAAGMDRLEFNGFDAPLDPNGPLATNYTASATNTRYGWSGYTYYVDVDLYTTDADGNQVFDRTVRYQGFVQHATVFEITGVTRDAESGVIIGYTYNNPVTLYQAEGNPNGGNWGNFFVNLTGEEISVSMVPHLTVGTDASGSQWGAREDGGNAGYGLTSGVSNQENGIHFYGIRAGWVTDAEGNKILASGEAYLQNSMDGYEIKIPAGGYGMTYKTQYKGNTPANYKEICAKEGSLVIEKFDAYWYDPADVNYK